MTIKNAELLTGEQANFINTLIRVNEASGWQAVVDLCKAAAPEGLFHQSMLFGVHFTDVGAEILLGEDGREYREVLDDIYVEVQQHPSVEPLLPMEFIAASSGDLDSVSGWFWASRNRCGSSGWSSPRGSSRALATPRTSGSSTRRSCASSWSTTKRTALQMEKREPAQAKSRSATPCRAAANEGLAAATTASCARQLGS